MGYKLDIRLIVRKHINTLVNDGTNKADFRDWFFFLLLPIGIAAALSHYNIFLGTDYINAIISGLSIYVGFAINLVVLLFTMVQRASTSTLRREFAIETIANITFSVVLSLLSIVSALLTQLNMRILGSYCYYEKAMNGIAYFLICEMILTILLLVRNMYFKLVDSATEDARPDVQ